jgi:hypothetical protein
MGADAAGQSAEAIQLQARGVANADTFQAEKLDNAATYGELKAAQTGGQMSRQLNTTLGNIDAVRAAANTDPSSPTGAAVRDNQEAIGTDQRNITVSSLTAQATQDKADAAYQRKAASDALLAGDISAQAAITKGNAGIASGVAGILGKVAAVGATPFTGGASLATLPLTGTGALY